MKFEVVVEKVQEVTEEVNKKKPPATCPIIGFHGVEGKLTLLENVCHYLACGGSVEVVYVREFVLLD
jgi:hypothetical protein